MCRPVLKTCVITLLALSSAGIVHGQGSTSPAPVSELEGAYEFVSLTKVVGKPEKYTSKTTSKQMEGLWLFKDGFFSHTEVGLRTHYSYSTSGRYEVKGNVLTLFNECASSEPARGGTDSYEFSLSGDVLTLIQSFEVSIPHSIEEGASTIVLRRVRPNNGMQRTRRKRTS
jgi:hypothetical protein